MGARDEKNGREEPTAKKPAGGFPMGLQLRSNTNATSHIHLRWGRAISGWGIHQRIHRLRPAKHSGPRCLSTAFRPAGSRFRHTGSEDMLHG